MKLVFLAAEEERVLGSWAYAQHLVATELAAGQLKIVNLHDSRERLLNSAVADSTESLWSIVQHSDLHAHQLP